MANWRKILLWAAGIGGGFALVAGILVGTALWWSSRPPKPKPWNTKAISASYDGISTEGDRNTLVFDYTLENDTDTDYKISSADEIHLAGKLRESNALSFGNPESEFVQTYYPIFVPAHNRVRLALRIAYPYGEKYNSDAPEDAQHDYETKLARYVSEKLGNLDGFVIMDERSRYKIELPNGWATRAKEPLRIKGGPTSP